MIYKTSYALACALILGVAQVNASVQGIAVGSSTSTTQVGGLVGGLAGPNIEYFIPLSGAFTGTYGVTPVAGGTAGTVADNGTGAGYNPASALNMFIRYDLSGENNPSSATSITFDFVDLDVESINDPSGFFESIRFSYFDDLGMETLLTDTLTDASAGFSTVAPGVTAAINFTGPNDPLSIVFTGLETIVNDISDLGGVYEEEFYLNVYFGSSFSRGGGNTAEELMSSITTQTVVPEPTAFIVWSLIGFTTGGMIYQRRRRQFA